MQLHIVMNELLHKYLFTSLLILCINTCVWAQQEDKLAGTATGTIAQAKPAGSSAKQADSLRSGNAREQMNNAWWTGPMLAPSAGTLPKGHFLAEPYLYDVTTPHTNSFGSLTYLLYGLANGFTVGAIPTFGFNKVSSGLSSSGIGAGDATLVTQYRLTKFHEGNWLPAAALNVQETFPTGKYDHLGDRPADGFGSGAYTTTVSLYLQTYFWLNTGRILRMRFNTSEAFSANVNIQDASVYGTETGFRGHAEPGSSLSFDASWEYSLTSNWVFALDIGYKLNDNTYVTGYNNSIQNPPVIQFNSGPSRVLIFAPAIEYNWNSSLGILIGTRLIPAGTNVTASVTPVVAVNFVY